MSFSTPPPPPPPAAAAGVNENAATNTIEQVATVTILIIELLMRNLLHPAHSSPTIQPNLLTPACSGHSWKAFGKATFS
jgi:hypothetical protein